MKYLVFEACRQSSDVLFTLDQSGSVGKQDFLVMVNFVRSLVADMNVNSMHRVAFQTYSSGTEVHYNLADSRTFTQQGLYDQMGVYYRGGVTNTGGAIRQASQNVFNGKRYCLIFCKKINSIQFKMKTKFAHLMKLLAT